MDGPPEVAPNLSPIIEENWIKPDTEVSDWLSEKRELMVRLRPRVFAAMRGSEAARTEASQVLFSHLGIKNRFLMKTELEDASAQISDDLCIMQQNETGDWCLTAASVCAPTYWVLRNNIGKSLSDLHGAVPKGRPELSNRISRVFSGMRSDQIFERCNWTVQAGDERYVPVSEKLFLAAATIRPEDALEKIWLRVERQTIRKLPGTGAVLFTIRICLDPLKAVFAVSEAKDAFAHAWTAAHPDIVAYKGWEAYDRLINYILE